MQNATLVGVLHRAGLGSVFFVAGFSLVFSALGASASEIGRLLAGLGADSVRAGGGGTDIGPLVRRGVPGIGHRTSGEHYFDWHHSMADTVDKVDPKDFQLNVAAMAVMTYLLADMPD